MLPRLILAATCLCLWPLGAKAHPHVYMDARLGLVYDAQGRLAAVDVEWAYDELYSLLIVSDLGLDPDGDGALTAQEHAALQGFDADWEPGFDGRLFLQAAGQRVALAGPEDFKAEYRDGRVVSRHRRPLAQPQDGATPLVVQAYDPEFYVDFTVPEAPGVTGRGDCTVALEPGDPAAAPDAYRRALDAALAQPGMEEEMVIVDIGAAGAEVIRVQCGEGRGS
ncbi:DUF1007 family protein [Paracoccus sp. (in: a-proteobacteria)]|uniref:DUF1007 family protein n=1 Tax=Paracoccus sp. TaxID=267 RepID=UPI0035B0243C